MQAIKFPQVNLDLGAGNNPNTQNLPVAICTNAYEGYENVCFFFSCYKMTPEERKRVSETGEIWLGVMAPRPQDDPNDPTRKLIMGTQPPVVVQVENPFTEITPPYVAYLVEAFAPARPPLKP